MATANNLLKINPNDTIEYIQIDSTYIFFDGAVSFLAGLLSLNVLVQSYKGKPIQYTEQDYVFFEGRKKATSKIFYFFPHDIYKYLIDNKWPNSIKIYYKHKPFDDVKEIDGTISGFVKVFLALGQATFIQYWELTKEKIIKRFGNDQTKWSSIFQFG